MFHFLESPPQEPGAELTRDSRSPDVAAGRGVSAFHLAQSFGCELVGVDRTEENLRMANEEASIRGVSDRVSVHVADAEKLPFEADISTRSWLWPFG